MNFPQNQTQKATALINFIFLIFIRNSTTRTTNRQVSRVYLWRNQRRSYSSSNYSSTAIANFEHAEMAEMF
ncbi:hypothetical protein [Anabaena azotica]|uniref:Uncharacterized protein n=1 Tax=Anabaena azotica FACHB-119 TaxID=947527 RepID=A0ABR8CY96_9NOST|nr:hypothetical protein [Anabaena azotica]MBD2499848.1 hypothetical protein [Anabaena azotica FACHB-119]